MKIGLEVQTVFGKGIITDIEYYNHFNRYGVELFYNPFWYNPVYFFKHEIN